MNTHSTSANPTERSSWRWVPSPQSNSSRSPPRRTSTAGSPRRALGTEPPVPAKNSDMSMPATVAGGDDGRVAGGGTNGRRSRPDGAAARRLHPESGRADESPQIACCARIAHRDRPPPYVSFCRMKGLSHPAQSTGATLTRLATSAASAERATPFAIRRSTLGGNDGAAAQNRPCRHPRRMFCAPRRDMHRDDDAGRRIPVPSGIRRGTASASVCAIRRPRRIPPQRVGG
jgi:hypothetical protein